MITEDFCSYEVAKLLKEKGFDGLCYCHEFTDYEGNFTTYHTEYPGNWNQSEPCVSIPTLGMAMKWLREEHHILITIIPQEIRLGVDKLCYGIYRITEDLYQPLYNGKVDNLVDSYEETIEVAIKYILENLI